MSNTAVISGIAFLASGLVQFGFGKRQQMNRKSLEFNQCSLAVGCILLVILLAGCQQSPESCPSQPPADLSEALSYAEDDQLAFRFPLDQLGNDVYPDPAVFCTSGDDGSGREYHAAEDYFLPAGTPVYAVADGIVSFSGPMGGYGWLIVVDHPQANIYSLYGHLSPSRWRLESGPVEKGDLIAYLGDPDENGGSAEQPLRPHLHFGIRAGQRTDYPGMGEWRWQAGWIKPCPKDLGWLQPSGVITGQAIPPGGFSEPTANFFEKWGVEFVLISIYLVGGVCAFVFAIKRGKTKFPAIYGGLMLVAGWFFLSKGTSTSYIIFSMAVILIVFAISQYIKHSRKSTVANSSK
jgi:murein DD-endopeptidase MepM/ murein hydrolase activator NlpD